MAEPVGSGTEDGAGAGVRTVASPGHASPNGPHGEKSETQVRSAAAGPPRRPGRLVVLAIAGGLAIVVGAWKGGPWIQDYFAHVATDDAFVAGDATTVPSRLTDVVEQVVVQNNDYVERGAILVRLDRRPYEIAVGQMRSSLQQAKLNVDRMVKSLETARAGLDQARDQVQSSAAALEESWRAVEGQQEQVRSRIAGLRSQAASLRASYAELVLAQKDYERVKNLVNAQTATREELDQKQAAFDSAREKYKVAEHSVQQARALLALAPNEQHPEQVPADLDRTDTQVRRAVAAGKQVLANLGLASTMHSLEPDALHAALTRLTDSSSDAWFDTVPGVRSARAQLDQAVAMLGGPSFDPARPYDHPSVVRAQQDLDDAELKLSYTEIRSPVSGFINRRAVNPGDHVLAGQGLMSIQPLDSIYIEANFKETQVADLAIGQAVAIAVDAYPGRVVRGRVSGFAPATGAASSMLPPENATGNFVKVVQRIPVRIELTEPNPRETPLLVGMSVLPEVDIKTPPSGPDAGSRLRGPEGRSSRQQETHP
ncbi:MAG: HlyD family secretion protein [Isosphaeraceae bacterium]|nr:HlyD family secretion protein [Isosphaeraceae bacterium]